MPTKSRRSRRKIRVVREMNPVVSGESPMAVPATATASPRTAAATEKAQILEAATQTKRVIREMEMIGLVTVVILVILILLYIFFR